MKKIQNIVALLVALISASSCQKNRPLVSLELDEKFQKLFSVADINKSLIINNISDDQEIRYGDNIKLVAKNTSQYPIIISDNPVPITILTVENDSWINIENNIYFMSSSGTGSFLLDKNGGEQLNYFRFPVQPIIPLDLEKVSNRIVRILLIGEQIVDQDKTGVFVGGYVDVLIAP